MSPDFAAATSKCSSSRTTLDGSRCGFGELNVGAFARVAFARLASNPGWNDPDSSNPASSNPASSNSDLSDPSSNNPGWMLRVAKVAQYNAAPRNHILG